ncbi:MAG: sugar transferase [Candidatus Cloacimonetes bacterium]|nr:sugar transferase [Candidatus Cloacimonadota bacterium]MDY0230721.1 sugar transferase [Candidatus Cloacimonadaceae bacterium]
MILLYILCVVVVVMDLLAFINKPVSVYKNKPEERNPMEGKIVHFVEGESEEENADGVRGHLEAIGESFHNPSFYEKIIKRGMDVALSFFGLVILSPLFLFISVWIIIDDPGPVLFTQKRMGKNKQYFKLHKFRSMKMSTPHDRPTHMLENPQQYITRAGRFIRAHSLDELPQIWDIFVGNMSVVGPRPGLWNQDLLTSERDKYGANDIKPGLTGWAQINGRDELEIRAKAKLDGEYVKNLSIAFDFKCFFKTIEKVLKHDGVVEGGTGEINKEQIEQQQEKNEVKK